MNRVTIITPVFNNKDDIINSIKSIEEQTYSNWEHIIIDDCSTDGTYDIIREYLEDRYQDDQERRDKIRLYQNEKNMGTYISRNIGLLESAGDYICFLDSDDKYHPDKIKRQVEILDKHVNLLFVNSYHKRENRIRGTMTGKGTEITIMFRKGVIEEIGYFDSVRFGADSEFKHRMIRKFGNNFATIKDVLYYAKKRPNSLTTSNKSGSRYIRQIYVRRYTKWHKNNKTLYMPFPLELSKRPFKVPDIMLP